MKKRDDIVQIVKDTLKDVNANPKNLVGRKSWTDAVLQNLCEACRDRTRLQCCPDSTDLNPAWLYDMVWYRMNENGCLAETPLVLESEWSTRMADLRYDFQKLLVAKADVKVLIADSHCCGDIKTMMSDEIAAFKCRAPDELYLLALWTENGFGFTIFDSDGKIMDEELLKELPKC